MEADQRVQAELDLRHQQLEQHNHEKGELMQDLHIAKHEVSDLQARLQDAYHSSESTAQHAKVYHFALFTQLQNCPRLWVSSMTVNLPMKLVTFILIVTLLIMSIIFVDATQGLDLI